MAARRGTTNGRGTTRVPVALPEMESAPERWLRNLRLSGFALTVLGLVILAVVVLAPGLKILVEQRQQIAALEQLVQDKGESVATLEDDVARWSDPTYIKQQARERLYYVFPGEFSYLVIDDGATVTSQNMPPISSEIQTTQVDWLRSILGSVFTAGLTAASPEQLVAPVEGSG